MPPAPTRASPERASPPRDLTAWVFLALAAGLVDVALTAWTDGPVEPGRGTAYLAWLLGGWLALGAGLGLALRLGAALLRRTPAEASARPAALVAVFVAVGVFARLDASGRGLAIAASLALGWFAFELARRLCARWRWAGDARAWAVAACVALGLAPEAGFERRAPAPAAQLPREGPSLLLVTIDTLRADRVGAYGHVEARTPTIDALAARGALFESAIAPSIWTGPSHASILTGLLPAHHGLLENQQLLAPRYSTLAELLGAAGYRTAAFVASAPVSERGSLLPGRFQDHDDDLRAPHQPPPELLRTSLGRVGERLLGRRAIRLRALWRPAEGVTDAAAAWLERDEPGAFFAWVHYFDPHLPYRPPPELLSERARAYRGPVVQDWGPMGEALKRRVATEPALLEQMGELYDAEVAHVDRELGRLLEAARRRAGPQGLWIVVTADHGESFGEHGIHFARDLYEPSLRVPLIVVPPDGLAAPRRVRDVVRLVDLAPTVLEALGLPAPLGIDGTSLLGALESALEPAPGPAVASILPLVRNTYRRPVLGVRTERWKAIWRLEGWGGAGDLWLPERRELYDLERDPRELDDVSSEHADVLEALWPLADLLGRPGELGERTLGERELEALRGLGYAR